MLAVSTGALTGACPLWPGGDVKAQTAPAQQIGAEKCEMMPRKALQRYRNDMPECHVPASAFELLVAKACSKAKPIPRNSMPLRRKRRQG